MKASPLCYTAARRSLFTTFMVTVAAILAAELGVRNAQILIRPHLDRLLLGEGMSDIERHSHTPHSKLDDLLNTADRAPMLPSTIATYSPAVASADEVPLIRLEKKLSEIRRVMEKRNSPSIPSSCVGSPNYIDL